MTTDPRAYGSKRWRMGLQGHPKAMPGGVGRVVIEANPALVSIASTPIQAQGTLPLAQAQVDESLFESRAPTMPFWEVVPFLTAHNFAPIDAGVHPTGRDGCDG